MICQLHDFDNADENQNLPLYNLTLGLLS
jgi:hypothetical protein